MIGFMDELALDTTRRPTRMVVIDDHGLFARGLELLLGAASDQRLIVVGATSDPFEAEDLVIREKPDVAIIDLSMPTRSGEQVMTALRNIAPSLRTLIVSGSNDLGRIRAALVNGADGFIPKTSDPAELLGPLLSVASGWTVLPRTVLVDLIGSRTSAPELTGRETWLVRRISTGAELKQLAAELNVSERTAKRAVAGLLERLGVETRIEAVALAGRSGLLDVPAEPHHPPEG